MKIVDRYLLREYLVAVLYCVAAFTMVQVLYDLFYHFSKFVAADLPARTIAKYYLYYLAPTVEFILPAALMLATLYTLWQFTRHGELTAMRASGLSLLRIMMPFLWVGIALTAVNGAIKEGVSPWAGLWADEFAKNNFHELTERVYLDQAHYNTIDRRVWTVEKFDAKHPTLLEGVKVNQERSDGTRLRQWTASRAEWLDGEWWFFDLRAQDFTADGNPIGTLARVPGSEGGIAMSFRTETPMDFVNEVKAWQYLSARDMIEYIRSHPDLSHAALASKWTDVHMHFALPWACLIVTFFAIPAGARSAREGALRGVFAAVLCFFAFHVLTQVGLFLAKREVLAPWVGAWFSNAVFFTAGLRMVFTLR
jgi:lipopolysaccharide export system permease protein